MTLEVQICTIGDGILKVPEIFLPEREDVKYLISWQIDNPLNISNVAMLACFHRKDVRLFTMQGQGLSRNRNNALIRTEGDIVLIGDDDCRYSNEYFDNIIKTYKRCNADIILFELNDLMPENVYQQVQEKPYPKTSMSYKKAMRHKGYYPCSCEMTLSRKAIEVGNIKFNEDFGLGSGRYICGEESVLIKDAEKQGLKVMFEPKVIVDTPRTTTGTKFLSDTRVQIAKGATFKYCYPKWEAWIRCWKEALHYAVYHHANAVQLFNTMWKTDK
ncbi:MAG: glycosyltransferase [Prevotellaceae bacterium]|nr:glycosyltransferase [Candidatus Colivivens equi]